MNVNKLIDDFENTIQIEQQNKFNIKMVYFNRKEEITLKELEAIKEKNILGYNDWRIPSVEEMYYITDYRKRFNLPFDYSDIWVWTSDCYYNLQCVFRLDNSDVTTTNGDEAIIFAPVMFVR